MTIVKRHTSCHTVPAIVPSSSCCSGANVELFSLMQEATQAENALIMENGTHDEEANADDLTVTLLLSSLRHVFSFPLRTFNSFLRIFFSRLTDCSSFDSFQSPHLLIQVIFQA